MRGVDAEALLEAKAGQNLCVQVTGRGQRSVRQGHRLRLTSPSSLQLSHLLLIEPAEKSLLKFVESTFIAHLQCSRPVELDDKAPEL